MTGNREPGAGNRLVESVSTRGGAWRRLILGGGRGNLLSLDLVHELGQQLHALESERGIKWLTIEGSGGEFSYGARIQEHTPELMRTVLPATLRIIKQLLAFPSPTAALVEGRCLGGGFELALACDDILALEDATFGLPEIRLAAFAPAAAGRARAGSRGARLRERTAQDRGRRRGRQRVAREAPAKLARQVTFEPFEPLNGEPR